jgi:hypothetical protein
MKSFRVLQMAQVIDQSGYHHETLGPDPPIVKFIIARPDIGVFVACIIGNWHACMTSLTFTCERTLHHD